MYKLTFKTSATNVPVLSKDEIDQIGEQLVGDFCPQALQSPMEIDIDRFITRYMGMEQDFQYLSHCGLYLGMTVFNDTDKVPVFNPDLWAAEYITVKAGTVIIDNSLLDERQEHRYRFTAGHEAAHGVLHSGYFLRLAELNPGTEPLIQCRTDSTKVSASFGRKSDRGWMEWQANRLASAILMPRSVFIKAARLAERRSRNANAALEAVTRIFNVSNDAAYYRLQELGIIPPRRSRSY